MMKFDGACLADLRAARKWLIAVCGLLTAGCGYNAESDPHSLQSVMGRQQAFTELITDAGGSAEEKTYPQFGLPQSAWAVSLSGATISDELINAVIERLKTQYFSELNFSGSTVTDEQLLRLDEANVGKVLLKLDLSDTGVTDRSIDEITSTHVLMSLNLSGTQVTKAAADRFNERLSKKRPPGVSKMIGRLQVTR